MKTKHYNILLRMHVGALVFLGAISSVACATYQGTAEAAARPAVIARESNWMMARGVPLVQQRGQDDCGAAALTALLQYWGLSEPPASTDQPQHREHRMAAGELQARARAAGLQAYVFSRGTMHDIIRELQQERPVIVGLGKVVDEKQALSHYEIVVGYEPEKKQVLLLDPGRGWQIDSLEGFAKEWAFSNAVTIVAFPSSTQPSPAQDDARLYAKREAISPDAKNYRAGDVIVISATTLAVVLLIVLVIILI